MRIRWEKNPLGLQGDTMKWVMIAAAAGLVYWYLRKEGYIDKWFAGTGDTVPPVAPGVTAPGATAVAVTGPESVARAAPITQPAPAPNQTIPASALIDVAQAQEPIDAAKAAAAYDPGSIHLTGPWKTGFDGWNYYRGQFIAANGNLPGIDKNIPIPTPESVGVVDRSKPITAAEYHFILTSKGLKGLGGFSGLAALIGGGYGYRQQGGWN